MYSVSYTVSYIVIQPGHGLKGALIRVGITKIKIEKGIDLFRSSN